MTQPAPSLPSRGFSGGAFRLGAAASHTVPADLRRVLSYNASTGTLLWLPRPKDTFANPAKCASWNTRYAGKPAFTARTTSGYLAGRFCGVTLMAHRVVWAIAYDRWPDGEIDHIDVDKTNNRLRNLRETTRSENERNKGLSAANSSGEKGVYWNSKNCKWEVRIGLHAAKYYFGQFSDFADAVSVAKQARAALHGEFARQM